MAKNFFGVNYHFKSSKLFTSVQLCIFWSQVMIKNPAYMKINDITAYICPRIHLLDISEKKD